MYENKSDEELVELIHGGDDKAEYFLFKKYSSVVRLCARRFFLIGGDSEDLLQEGMIGLNKGIRTFNGKSSFKTFAYLCITRQMQTAVKTFDRKKNSPLKNFVPLTDVDENQSLQLASTLDPEQIFLNNEQKELFDDFIKRTLSLRERKILEGYLGGESYKDLSERLSLTTKQIDNSLQRIKSKIKEGYED